MQTKFFEVQISVRRTVKNSKIQTLIFLLLCPILYTQPVDVSLEVLQVRGAALLLLCPTVYCIPSLLMCLLRCSRSVALLCSYCVLYCIVYTQPVDVSLEVLQVCGATPCSYCVLYCTQSVDVSLEVLQVRGAALLLLLQLVNVPEDSVQLIPILRPGSTYFYH